MVARVCQLYPNATASKVVTKFFHVMNIWPWPDPVQLKDPENGPAGVQATVWNPRKNPRDRRHIMPVITPAFPSMCSTHNINGSTKDVIMGELLRANSICDEIALGKLQWKDLFTKHTFFTEGYKYYLSINATSRTNEAHQLWSGTVESKVRLLVIELENNQSCGVARAHPFVKGFERVHKVQNEDQVQKVAAENSLQFQVKEIGTKTTDDINDPRHKAAADAADNEITMDTVKEDPEAVAKAEADSDIDLYSTTYYIGLRFAPDARQIDVSWPIARFKEICTSWANYNSALNYLCVQHIRDFDLPDDVFGLGEIKPSKGKKKGAKKAKASELNGSAKKRKTDEGLATTEIKKQRV